jgi:glutamyl-tRNA synthetase
MPDEGETEWDDMIRGRIEFPNEELEDLVLVRSDGRPTYNFASPVEDIDDKITHVIRGNDHVSNTPKQLQIIRALAPYPPFYVHAPDVLGDDGKNSMMGHSATRPRGRDSRRRKYFTVARRPTARRRSCTGRS